MAELDFLERYRQRYGHEPFAGAPDRPSASAAPRPVALPAPSHRALVPLTNLARTLLAVMMEDAQGEANARPRSYLHARVQERLGVDVSDSLFREAKEELLESRAPLHGEQLPAIGSGPKGYFVCVSPVDHEHAAKFLEDKGRDLIWKAYRIREKDRVKNGGPSLPLPAVPAPR